MDLCGPIPLGLRVSHNQTASGRPGHVACLGQENINSKNTPTCGFEKNPDPSESRLPQSSAAEPALLDAPLSTCIEVKSDEQARNTSGGQPLCVHLQRRLTSSLHLSTFRHLTVARGKRRTFRVHTPCQGR